MLKTASVVSGAAVAGMLALSPMASASHGPPHLNNINENHNSNEVIVVNPTPPPESPDGVLPEVGDVVEDLTGDTTS